ncbi:MAG: two-component regulator propeller domain-containing protein [Acidobacteriota bacterium]
MRAYFRLQRILRLALVCGVLTLFSSLTLGQYRFDSWTTDSGLPQNSVNAIAQTTDGYLWFTTLDGVVRYDGVRFTIFDKGNTPGILSNRFVGLLEDREGALWLATEDSGVTRYKDGWFTTYTTREGLSSDLARALWLDANQHLLVRTVEGLSRWNGERFVADSLSAQVSPVNPIYAAPSGALWFCDSSKLHQLKDGKTVSVTGDFKDVSSIIESRDGRLWLGTTTGQLTQFAAGQFTTLPIPSSLPKANLRTLLEDREGTLWIGTAGAGLWRYRDGQFKVYTTADGLSDNVILSLYQDREGTLWIGTGNRGINRLSRRMISVYSTKDGLNADSVYPIYEDRAGAIWLGGLGLNRFYEGKFTVYTDKNGLQNYNVTSLYEDREGRLWIGAVAGLSFMQNGRFTSLTNRLPLPPHNYSVWAIHQDRQGALWFGSDKGLLRYANQSFTHYTTKDGLPSDDVKWIHEDRNGQLWFATYGGLSRLQDGKFISLTEADGLSSNRVRTIYEDREGVMWIGTYDGGLNRFKDGRLTRYTTADGLFSNGAFQILDDERGNFWIGSNRGIYRVGRAQLNDFADGKIHALTCVSYGKEDGLLNTECNGGRQPSGIRDRQGRLWIATQGGAAVIDVAHLSLNPLPPSVMIEAVRVDRESASFNGDVNIAPGKENLEIHYTGLSFIKPEFMHFRYKMEGLDRDWVEAGNRRAAYYPYLPPGSYSFAVMAANSDGVWSEEAVRLHITVLPPFWRTWRFTLLMLAVLAALTFFIYRWRVLTLKRAHAAQEAFSRQLIASQEQERKRIAAELHDSLGQNLLVIKNWAMLGLNAAQKKESGREEFEEIATAATQAIGEVREIAYNLRPHLLDEVGLTEALKAMVKRMAAASTIAFESEIDPIDHLFSKEAEIGIYRIVQEAINNIARHSEATRAFVIIRRDIDNVLLEIRDDGKGIESALSGKGFGLTGMQERARMLGGRFAVHSMVGQGTTIEVRLSVEKSHDES